MKKTHKALFCSAILIFLILTSFCLFALRSGFIYHGMSFSDFSERSVSDNSLRYRNYLFYHSYLGGHVIAFINHSEEITDIRCFDKWQIDNSDYAFSRIRYGMDIYEVVAMVGIPIESDTFGMCSLTFQSASETRYRVYFSENIANDEQGLTVSSVVPLASE